MSPRPAQRRDGLAAASLAPVRDSNESLVDRIAHEVRAAIMAGGLRPGERLAISELAETLNTSAIPVREALARLAGQGLVILRPSRSAIVAPIEADDLREIYRLRILIEVDAAGRAAEHFTDSDLGDLSGVLDRMCASAYSSEKFWALHTQFHRLLLRPVLTPRLDRVITDLWSSAERYVRIGYMETDVLASRPVLERHLPLVEAAGRRSGAEMAEVLRDHLVANESELSGIIEGMLSAAVR